MPVDGRTETARRRTIRVGTFILVSSVLMSSLLLVAVEWRKHAVGDCGVG